MKLVIHFSVITQVSAGAFMNRASSQTLLSFICGSAKSIVASGKVFFFFSPQ